MPHALYVSHRHRRRWLIAQLFICVTVCSVVLLLILALFHPRPRQRYREPQVRTGIDDVSFFNIPVRLQLGEAICRHEAESVVAAATLPIVSPDSEMQRVGRCTDRDLNLYATQHEPEILYVKTDIYRYLVVWLED